MRTSTDKKYRPVRREFSRYGIIEKALHKLQKSETTTFTSADVALITKRMSPTAVAAILKFTNGVSHDVAGRTWGFNGEPVRVDAG